MLVMWSQAIWEKNNKNVGLVNLNKYRIYLSSLHPPKKKSGQDEKRREKLPGNKKSIPIEAMKKRESTTLYRCRRRYWSIFE